MYTNIAAMAKFGAQELNIYTQGRIKASAGPGAVPNAGPLDTYNQLTTPTNCGPPKLRARVLQHPSTPLMRHCLHNVRFLRLNAKINDNSMNELHWTTLAHVTAPRCIGG